MANLRRLLFLLLLSVLLTAPVMAGNNDGKAGENEKGAGTASPGAITAPAIASPSPTINDVNLTALLGVLMMKGVLTPADANAIRNADPSTQFRALTEALASKGILNAGDLEAAIAKVKAEAPPSTIAAATPATAVVMPGGAAATPVTAAEPPPEKGPPVVDAVAPVRVLPLDPPKTEGLIPAFKAGPISLRPYGFIKATAEHDSSMPNGDDFPFVGLFLTTTNVVGTGPTQDPEFHLKARSTRFGLNVEWPDMTKKITLTGRIEGDFEGNFSEVDNRDVSSIRSNEPQLRLAWARLDYHYSDKTDLYFEGGQDWTLFGSSVLPNLLETTFLGAFYGDIYTRSPQMQFGLVQTLTDNHKVKLSPTFAIMMPSSGQILKLGSLGLEGQIGEGEREGADADRPEVEGRLALQFQLDTAPGVAPAQILWDGVYSKRRSLAIAPLPPPSTLTGTALTNYEAAAAAAATAFPHGFTVDSTIYGNQIGIQLPTRWFTIVASGYRGGDLRFFFGGQVNSYYTDMNGLSGIGAYGGPIVFSTQDGGPLAAAGSAVVATNAAGSLVVAPQRPVRSFGGFVNLGLPLSRWFNANPDGHNGGWQLYFHVGKDQVVHRDLTNPGAVGPLGAQANVLSPLPLLMGKVAAVTLYYKLNRFISFGFEQSIYATRLEPGGNYSIAGSLSNEWQDHRTEFGPVFTF